jgi:hypothetical protein
LNYCLLQIVFVLILHFSSKNLLSRYQKSASQHLGNISQDRDLESLAWYSVPGCFRNVPGCIRHVTQSQGNGFIHMGICSPLFQACAWMFGARSPKPGIRIHFMVFRSPLFEARAWMFAARYPKSGERIHGHGYPFPIVSGTCLDVRGTFPEVRILFLNP